MLADASLWDLVQMNCEGRTRGVVRVSSNRGFGFLFFSEGQIVHAVWGGMQGERAALEILSWRHGSWESCEHAWPDRNSVSTPWQGLLLRAAQRIDEAKRPEVSARPQRLIAVGSPAPARIAKAGKAVSGLEQQRSSAEPNGESSGLAYRPNDFEHAVRMDPNGNLTAGHGQAQEFAALAAYVCRVGDLIGELLGMGKLIGADCHVVPEAQCLIYRKANGETIGLRPRPGVDLTQLKQQLQL